MRLDINLSQKQILSAQLIQSVEILQMSAQELEKYVEELSLENPVIELSGFSDETSGAPSSDSELIRKAEWLSSTDRQNRAYYKNDGYDGGGQDSWQDIRQTEETLSEHLHSQLIIGDFSDKERGILEFLILSLDSSGYLTISPEAAAEYLNVPEALVRGLVRVIQALDPAGVGAYDLPECLMLQTERLGLSGHIINAVISDHLNDLAKNHISKIAKELHAPTEDILKACEIIRNLNPKPGSYFSDRQQPGYVRPDAVIVKTADGFEAVTAGFERPLFNISDLYENMLRQTEDESVKKYLKEKMSQAKWLTECISDRKSSVERIVGAIVELQQDFFLKGPGHKRPMRLADLSGITGLHESTVSRAMREKYLQCQWGVFQLNYFLTSVAVVSKESESKTPEQVKELIKEIIDGEDKGSPFSDQQICSRLEASGLPISRRTVNKYRTEMGIPDKSGRSVKNN